MSVYPKAVNEATRTPLRSLDAPEAEGRSVSLACGSYLRFQVSAARDVVDAAFTSNGCGFMLAAAEIVSEHLRGKGLEELHGLSDERLQSAVSGRLGDIPPMREQCLNVTFDAVHHAFAKLREHRLAASRDEALICTCFSVSETTIEKCIAENNLTTIEEVSKTTRAGGGCGSCRMLIQEMLDNPDML